MICYFPLVLGNRNPSTAAMAMVHTISPKNLRK